MFSYPGKKTKAGTGVHYLIISQRSGSRSSLLRFTFKAILPIGVLGLADMSWAESGDWFILSDVGFCLDK